MKTSGFGQRRPSRRQDDWGSGSGFAARCILQVGGDEDDVLIFRRVLRKAGLACQLQVVPDGQTAIAYLSGAGAYADRRKYPLPYLVLLDLGPPMRGGLEALQWIRRHPSLKKLVVMVLSSSALRADVARACELGADSYFAKPSGLPQTLEMAQLLEGWWLRYRHFASDVESADGSSPGG